MAQQAQAQAQQTAANPGVPGIKLHFWDQTTASYAMIATLYNKGCDYTYEDVVRRAWGEICDLYFPKVANGPRWSIERGAYRDLPPNTPSNNKPDLIAVRLTPGQPQPDHIPQFDSRDYLWIECKAASEDKPSGWKSALAEIVTRLSGAHPTRNVFTIVAIGWKCMYFIWEPTNAAAGLPQLFIQPDNNSTKPWLIDHRIRPIAAASWVNIITGQIHPTQAMGLDCWTPMSADLPNILQNHHALGSIEQFLVGIQNVALQGLNPEDFVSQPSDMPFQASDGTRWSGDRQNTSTQQSEASAQPSSPSDSSGGNPLSAAASSSVTAALAAFPQISTQPYQQPTQLVFGINRQTPGMPAYPTIQLDPRFREAASNNSMIRAFVKSMDDISSGNSR